VAARGTQDDRRRMSAVLRDRVVDLIRRAPIDRLAEEYADLAEFLASESCGDLSETDPAAMGNWIALCDLLGTAARRRDSDSIQAVILKHPTYGERMLEVLARDGAPLFRKGLRSRLEPIADSHLSRLLGDFEEVGLIVRLGADDGRSVMVMLGPEGREWARTRGLLPDQDAEVERKLDKLAIGVPALDGLTTAEGELSPLAAWSQ
jgi:DNA-binding MarR family transcriptional regulator